MFTKNCLTTKCLHAIACSYYHSSFGILMGKAERSVLVVESARRAWNKRRAEARSEGRGETRSEGRGDIGHKRRGQMVPRGKRIAQSTHWKTI